MKPTIAFLAATVCFAASSTAYALYSVSFTGDWPKTWPKELESLRAQSRTLVGPEVENRHYAIPFSKRDEFEAAWQHLLKVKTKGAPIILVRGPNFFLGGERKAGVVVHSPPEGTKNPEAPIHGVTNVRERWMNATYIELVVDGEIVDLNRIRLPADTPIVDERFPEGKKAPWGEPVEGLQCWLEADRTTWKAGDVPTFKLHVRDLGKRELVIHMAYSACKIEVDGDWYRWGGPVSIPAGPWPAGKQYEDFEVVVKLEKTGWVTDNKRLDLKPG
ncbi:MAG TPA: hypothetical protein VKS79_06670 [Gemmataceae bacterium]|nr:hypothetical protein [Gemmataceae bacterium]